MRVCEICAGSGYTALTYNRTPIKVLCGCCLGTGLLCLGHESRERYASLRNVARHRAAREGWYEVQWAGEPGNARRVYVPCQVTQERAAS